MSLSARRELIACLRPRYQAAGRKEKQRILDEFVATTGLHRKYATSVLNRPLEASSPPARRGRSATYGEAVRDALLIVWLAANQLCSKRLVPFLPEFVAVLERHGHLSLSDQTRSLLLEVSPATADRLLAEARRTRRPSTRRTARPGSLLKHLVPVRTFADWNDPSPGFLEADLVAHCGTSVHGAYLNTLTLTDVSTAWTECFALLFDDHKLVLQAIAKARELLPFPLLGLDTDNGSEFLNHGVLTYCSDEQITFTRSRPYKKNDQCYVEQKNGSVVRRLVGYDRYEGPAACSQLAALYGVVRLYVNFFQPCLKLKSKRREGAKVIKKYEPAQTPYQRVLASDQVSEQTRQGLTRQYEGLDPVALLKQIEWLQDSLWQYAYRSPVPLDYEPPALGLRPKPVVAPPPAKGSLAKTGSAPSESARTYRRTDKPTRYHLVEHTWRTRPDPFLLARDRIEELLTQEPSLGAKALLCTLQGEYPGQYDDNLLRTLQRRVKARKQQDQPACPVLIEPTAIQVGGNTG